MKTILSNISGMFLIGAACLLGAGSMTSCTDGFEDANRPGNKIDNEQLNRDNFASGSFLVQLQNQTFPEQEKIVQFDAAFFLFFQHRPQLIRFFAHRNPSISF